MSGAPFTLSLLLFGGAVLAYLLHRGRFPQPHDPDPLDYDEVTR